MFQKILVFPLFLMLICGCYNPDKVVVPDDVLPREKMVEVLIDMHLAEAVAERDLLYADTAVMVMEQYYDDIFAIHETSREEYMRSMDFYQNNPLVMQEIYNEVIETLSTRQAEWGAIRGVDNAQRADTASVLEDTLEITEE